MALCLRGDYIKEASLSRCSCRERERERLCKLEGVLTYTRTTQGWIRTALCSKRAGSLEIEGRGAGCRGPKHRAFFSGLLGIPLYRLLDVGQRAHSFGITSFGRHNSALVGPGPLLGCCQVKVARQQCLVTVKKCSFLVRAVEK